MEKKLWFKAKTYGYGWTPSTWEGWSVIALYVVILVWMMREIESSPKAVVYFLVKVGILTMALLYISYKKGEKAGWRWGKE